MRRLIIVGPRDQRWQAEAPMTPRERTRGLRGRTLGPGEAMLFDRCRSVHTIGMASPITVAFLDASWQVVRVERLPAGRLARARDARHVLECHIGADVRVGDLLMARPGGPAIRDVPGNARPARARSGGAVPLRG
jgi:uncharacterized membrane protein (UPF0127 family)